MKPPFRSVLVANRGEIAVRVIGTLARLGIRSVAVHTPADDGARHVREADVAVAVAGYLDADALVAAALAHGAEAVHPGYGFLSESPVLARACAAAGLVWVGPEVRALELMGDKIASRAHVAGLGVPVVPGAAGTDSELLARAEDVGFPLIVKPSAGGGGKGMQVVRAASELPAALAAAHRVAAAAFGDDTLLLERLVVRPRHIEAQVLGDRHGDVVLVGLRECSLQRRHQKVIEEAPAPYPQGEVREQIGEAAVRIARSVDYVGAGTVELLVSGADSRDWYFLEMNTRLQVEHPVTEEVTGLDLVEAQLRVAAGEPVPQVPTGSARGRHAVEARVYAERPDRGFVPSTGRLLEVVEPDGVRVDSGVRTGQVVGADYDPMLLKVIAVGDTRAAAMSRLDEALAETVLLGVHTNLTYLRAVLAAPEVAAGTADTTFLDTFVAADPPAPTDAVLDAAVAALAPAGSESSPWGARSGWRIGDHAPVTVTLLLGEEEVTRVVPQAPPSGPRVVTTEMDTVWVWHDGVAHELRRRTRADRVARSRRERAGTAPDPQLRSPMPGTVVTVPVASGTRVRAGDVVAVIEAMKMENPVLAPVDGVVDVAVRAGQTVAADQVLAVVHPS